MFPNRRASTRPYRPTSRARLARLALLGLVAAPLAAATLTVDQVQDLDADDAACSLREAIVAANTDAAYHGCPAGSGPDRIVFALTTPATIVLIAPLPNIEQSLLLRGPGAALLTLDGQDQWPLLNVDPPSGSGWLGVEELTLASGLAPDGAGALVTDGATALFRRVLFESNHATQSGGGLMVQTGSSARVEECWFSGNSSAGTSGGGALYATGASTVAIDRTTFSGNFADHANAEGGAIKVNEATAWITRSTLSGNGSERSGGAIALSSMADLAFLSVLDSTITGNGADGSGDGGGIIVRTLVGASVTLELGNTIVAGNTDFVAPFHVDLSVATGAVVTSHGFNLIGSSEGASPTFAPGLPNGAGDWVGSAASPLDPRLGALDFHGADIPTHRPNLAPLSPTVDAGACPGAAGDQRGFGDTTTGLRVVDLGAVPNGPASDGCDIGAHERGADPGVDPALFESGFEEGHTLLWSSEAPSP